MQYLWRISGSLEKKTKDFLKKKKGVSKTDFYFKTKELLKKNFL